MIYRNWETSCLNRAEAAEAELNRIKEKQGTDKEIKKKLIIEMEIELMKITQIATNARTEAKNAIREIENARTELTSLKEMQKRIKSKLPQRKATKKILQRLNRKTLTGILCISLFGSSFLFFITTHKDANISKLIVDIVGSIIILGLLSIFIYGIMEEY